MYAIRSYYDVSGAQLACPPTEYLLRGLIGEDHEDGECDTVGGRCARELHAERAESYNFV